MSQTRSFHEVIRARHSVRSFRPDPVPDAVLRSVFEEAQLTASNCNTQPWQVHVVSGAKRDALSTAMLAAEEAGVATPDFTFSQAEFHGLYQDRAKAQGAVYYQAVGVPREAFDERRDAYRRNLEFFGAPHAALLFMPVFGDGVRVAADIGMYAQTLLLSLVAHGLGGIPQTMLGFYADAVREELGIDPSLKMLFGISFGYPDTEHAANSFRIGRAPIEESVTFYR